jgi:hypothetical protein
VVRIQTPFGIQLSSLKRWVAYLISRPVFTEDAVSSLVYINVLQNDFIQCLIGYSVHINKAWFQQDGARPHTASTVGFFKETVFSGTDFLMFMV